MNRLARDEPNQGNYVVLVHGLGRTSSSMRRPHRFLVKQGYSIINCSYPSTQLNIERLAEEHLGEVIREKCKDQSKKINFVSHSLGSILIRAYLKHRNLENLGRVVMLAPPNQGSELADWLKEFFLYQWVLGQTGQQLGTDAESLPNQLGPVNFELGIIAGNRNINPISSMIIPGSQDGKVSVDRAKVEGMKDFLVVNRSHSLIMNSKEVLEQINFFLSNGFFKRI